jgi:hypothetical protein
MTNESIDPLRPEEESIPDGGQTEERSTESQDYVSELRETLESEAEKEKPKRKTGLFDRFTKRLKSPPVDPVDAQKHGELETASEPRPEESLTTAVDGDDIASAVSLVPIDSETEPHISPSYDEVEFSEPAQLPTLDQDDDLWSHAAEEPLSPSTPADEESSQWKTFLDTLRKRSEPKAGDEVLDDETLASRVERSIPYESQAEREWGKSEEPSPFAYDQEQPKDETPEGKKITGSLFLDESEEIFSEGEGNIWSGLRQELQETEEEIIKEDVSEDTLEEDDAPDLNISVLDWDEGQEDQVRPELPLDKELVPEEEFIPYESQPFSEKFAHVFGEEAEDISEPEPDPDPEPSVQEIRTIVMEDYEEPDDGAGTKKKAKRAKSWVRTVLLVLIGAGLVFLIVLVSMPTIVQWIQPPTPAPAAAVQPATAIPMEGMPYPTGVRMTGGWFFYLQPSTMEDGRWVPQTSEWLNGSELRRIVALPWTRQLEAVVQSVVQGDSIELHMSNGDILTYLVEEISQIDRGDVSILTSNKPSLALVLYKQEEEARWVVTANLRE